MLIVDVIEVCGYLSVGSVKRVCVDRSVSPEFSPFVRSVSIADGSMIIVEYEDYGCEEGGVCIEFIYESIESAITAAEAYLKVGVGGLANFTKSVYTLKNPAIEILRQIVLKSLCGVVA